MTYESSASQPSEQAPDAGEQPATQPEQQQDPRTISTRPRGNPDLDESDFHRAEERLDQVTGH